ncbi:hypothetical protein I2W78_08405 [Streptomyces spinoverrucosus]|uniref:hypothetical protein n=1 Tax=Streptomyces spinoverrucosus TaxID=284043 RepID=UPI0018C3B876|nr:hypothetical protein [Streptomyces spinoverrucosus]MBG0851864.1 hypothetical protein [Streptomyces spinoverrucosus]
MSEETVPQQGGGDAQPKGLLQQMEELMAALNADLSALDADLQAAGTNRSTPPAAEERGVEPPEGWDGSRGRGGGRLRQARPGLRRTVGGVAADRRRGCGGPSAGLRRVADRGCGDRMRRTARRA